MNAASNTRYKKSSGKKISAKKCCTPEELLKALRAAEKLIAEKKESSPLAALQSCGIFSPIILLGFQHIRTRRTIDWIRENFYADESAGMSSFFGNELGSKKSLENIISSLGNLSLFARNELIVIYEAEKVKSAVSTPLVEAIKRGNENTLVVVTAETMNQKTPLLSQLAPSATLVEFTELAPGKLRRWIEKEVERAGDLSGIEPGAIEALTKFYGSDVSALAREVSKLSLLTESGTKISRELVEKISMKAPEVTSFELLKQISRKNATTSVALARDLLEQGFYPLQVSAFLSRCIRTLLAQSNGGSNDTGLAPELYNSWFLRNLGAALRLFSPSDLMQSLEVLKDLDFQLKDSKMPDSLILTLAVQKMALRNFH